MTIEQLFLVAYMVCAPVFKGTDPDLKMDCIDYMVNCPKQAATSANMAEKAEACAEKWRAGHRYKPRW